MSAACPARILDGPPPLAAAAGAAGGPAPAIRVDGAAADGIASLTCGGEEDGHGARSRHGHGAVTARGHGAVTARSRRDHWGCAGDGAGDDSLTVPLMSIGGTGVVSVVANIAPRKVYIIIFYYNIYIYIYILYIIIIFTGVVSVVANIGPASLY